MPLLDDGDDFGTRLRGLRLARALSQQELAGEEMSVSYVSLLETGKRAPSEAVLAVLASRLGCSADFLLTGRADKDREPILLKITFGDIALQNGDHGEALQAFSEALAARPLLRPEEHRRARLGQAQALEKLGRLEAAVQLLEDLREDPATELGSAEWSQLVVSLSRCHRNLGDHIRSVDIGEEALRRLEAEGIEPTEDHMQIGSTLIGCYSVRGDLLKAQLVARRMIEAADRLDSPFGRGVVYWNAGLVANDLGQAEEAVGLLERAHVLLAESDDRRLQAMLKVGHAFALLQLDAERNGRRALELLNQADTPLEEVGSLVEKGGVALGQASALLSLGCPEEAEEHAYRAVGLREISPVDSVAAHLVIARARAVLGDPDGVTATLDTTEGRLRTLPRSRRTAALWRQIGDLWARQQQTARALTAYQQALDDAGLHPVASTAPRGARARS